jgi:hypothetical protein
MRTPSLPSETVVTTDHDEIKAWADAHGARPVQVLGSGDVVLDLPQIEMHEITRPVDWDAWFDAFETWKLAFLYQSRRADGTEPIHNELVARA